MCFATHNPQSNKSEVSYELLLPSFLVRRIEHHIAIPRHELIDQGDDELEIYKEISSEMI